MAEQRQTFWGWVSENPIAAIMILIGILGAVALVVGYREGFTAIITGMFGAIKGDDAANKIRRLEIARKDTDARFADADGLIDEIRQQQTIHDGEVRQDVENAKAECDEMDTDELVDIGNSMLRDHGAFRGEN